MCVGHTAIVVHRIADSRAPSLHDAPAARPPSWRLDLPAEDRCCCACSRRSLTKGAVSALGSLSPNISNVASLVQPVLPSLLPILPRSLAPAPDVFAALRLVVAA